MKWGLTKKEREAAEKERSRIRIRKRSRIWVWFAWHPVRLHSARWVWLEKVHKTYKPATERGMYEYTEIEDKTILPNKESK